MTDVVWAGQAAMSAAMAAMMFPIEDAGGLVLVPGPRPSRDVLRGGRGRTQWR